MNNHLKLKIMKKFLFLAIAAAAMTSCSQDEVLEVAQKEAIAFNNGFINNATRAIDPSVTNTTVSQFNVWGTVTAEAGTATTAIFANTNVTGTAGTGKTWNTVGVTQYWIEGAKYNFAGLINAGTTVTTGNDNLPSTVTFTQDYTEEKDLLYARSTEIKGKASGNSAVPMTFDHMLSKVGFKITNNNAANSKYTYKVTNIQITSGLATVGTATISQDASKNNVYTWNNQGTNTTTPLAFGAAVAQNTTATNAAAEAIAEQASMYSNNEHLLIPHTYNELTVAFTLETIVNGQTIKTNESVTKKATTAVTFNPGTYYMINIVLSVGEPIQFTVTSTETWSSPATDVQTTTTTTTPAA